MRSGGRGAGGGFEAADGSDPPRLVDRPAGDAHSPEGWAVDLLRRAERHRPPVGSKQRVRMGLAHVGKRRGALVLRPAIAIAVLVGCGAVASAALGHWPTLVSDAYHRLMATPAPAASSAASARLARSDVGRARAADPAATSVATGSAESPSLAAAPGAGAPSVALSVPSPAPAIAPSVGSARAAVTPLHPARRAPMSSAARATASASMRDTATAARARQLSSPSAAGSDDTTPVIEAMRALRVEGNPVRARVLLAGYLDRYPRGTLAEEALAMSIEAAIAHRDGDAAALARKYLRLYPAGHFSKLARQTLDGGASRAGN